MEVWRRSRGMLSGERDPGSLALRRAIVSRAQSLSLGGVIDIPALRDAYPRGAMMWSVSGSSRSYGPWPLNGATAGLRALQLCRELRSLAAATLALRGGGHPRVNARPQQRIERQRLRALSFAGSYGPCR